MRRAFKGLKSKGAEDDKKGKQKQSDHKPDQGGSANQEIPNKRTRRVVKKPQAEPTPAPSQKQKKAKVESSKRPSSQVKNTKSPKRTRSLLQSSSSAPDPEKSKRNPALKKSKHTVPSFARPTASSLHHTLEGEPSSSKAPKKNKSHPKEEDIIMSDGQESPDKSMLEQLQQALANVNDGEPPDAASQEAIKNMMAKLNQGFRPPTGELEQLVGGLQPELDPDTHLASLTELCHVLSLANEDSINNSTAEMMYPHLIRFMDDVEMDKALLAIRALTNLMEASPGVVSPVTDANVIPILMSKLLSVEYIDIAEQSLKALEQIAYQRPRDVLQEGFLSASLMIMGFFSMDFQRVIANITSQICTDIPDSCVDLVMDALPSLAGLLDYDDRHVLESVTQTYYRLTSAMLGRPTHVKQVLGENVIRSLIRLLSFPQTSPHQAWLNACKALTIGASSSPEIGLSILQLGVAQSLLAIFSASPVTQSPSKHTVSTPTPEKSISNRRSLGSSSGPSVAPQSRTGQQLKDALKLTNVLLPPIPSEKLKGAPQCLIQASGHRISGSGESSPLLSLPDSVAALNTFSQSTLPLVIEVHRGTATPEVAVLCAGIVVKIVTFCTADSLRQILRDITVASYIAGCLDSGYESGNMGVLTRLVLASEILVNKLPTIYIPLFVREGVEGALKLFATTLPKEAAPTESDTKTPKPVVVEQMPPGDQLDFEQFLLRARGKVDEGVDKEAIQWCHERAKDIVSVHFATSTSSTKSQSNVQEIGSESPGSILRHLRDVATALKNLSTQSDNQVREARDTLMSLRSQLLAPQGVSAHEFLNSGIVSALLEFFGPALHSDSFQSQGLARLRVFVDVFFQPVTWEAPSDSPLFLDSPQDDMESPKLSGNLVRDVSLQDLVNTNSSAVELPNALVVLVWKLIEVFEKIEKFPIMVHDQDGLQTLSQGLQQLTRTLKLTLGISDSKYKETLKEMPPMRIGIDPLAPVGAIEEFLQSRGIMKSPASSSKSRTRSLSDNAQTEGTYRPPPPSRHTRSLFLHDEHDEDFDEELEEEYDEYGEPRHEDVLMPPSHPERDPTADLGDGLSHPGPSEPTEPSGSAFANHETPQGQSAEKESKRDLALTLNGHPLDMDMTVLQAVYLHGECQPSITSIGLRALWEPSFPLKYQPTETLEATSSSLPSSSSHVHGPAVLHSVDQLIQQKFTLIPKADPGDDVKALLSLLSITHVISQSHHDIMTPSTGAIPHKSDATPAIPSGDFMSQKMNAKIVRQLQDVLCIAAGAVPSWCLSVAHHYPFLIPFQTRLSVIQATAFDVYRALHYLQSQNDAMSGVSEANRNLSREQPRQYRVGRLPRQKVRIQRDHILKSAEKVIDQFGESRSIVEIEYHNEPGTGLGPTQEFYTLVCHELRLKRHELWRHVEPALGDIETELHLSSDLVHAPWGLFPRPIAPTVTESDPISPQPGAPRLSFILKLFRFMGKFVWKAIKDGRLLDLPFSYPFFSLMCQRSVVLDDIAQFNPELCRSLKKLQAVATHIQSLKSSGASADDIAAVTMDGCLIDDLSLDMTLPGYPHIELIPGGGSIPVSPDNLADYVTKTIEMTLDTGIKAQMAAFREGLSQQWSESPFNGFSHLELDILLRGEEEPWTDVETLREAIKCEHGYSASSRPVDYLLQVMTTFTPSERHAFMSFVTGTPRMPVGGLASLHPPLTVVRKVMDGGAQPDHYLPSVMTCVNYLKLPEYSSESILKKQLFTAMREGKEFHLS